MKDFFKLMPPSKPGRWVAVVIRYNMRRRYEYWTMRFNGLRRAYIAARLMAWWDDQWAPDWNGIEWAVRREKPNEQQSEVRP